MALSTPGQELAVRKSEEFDTFFPSNAEEREVSHLPLTERKAARSVESN
jgi:phosphoenolpyruvate carboxylase